MRSKSVNSILPWCLFLLKILGWHWSHWSSFTGLPWGLSKGSRFILSSLWVFSTWTLLVGSFCYYGLLGATYNHFQLRKYPVEKMGPSHLVRWKLKSARSTVCMEMGWEEVGHHLKQRTWDEFIKGFLGSKEDPWNSLQRMLIAAARQSAAIKDPVAPKRETLLWISGVNLQYKANFRSLWLPTESTLN